MSSRVRARLQVALVLAGILGYETYALFVRRSGETANLPSAADTRLSPEIAGAVTLEQTFVMDVDQLESIALYPHPSSGAPEGTVQLLLTADGYSEPLARFEAQASAVAVTRRFVWTLPRIAQSAGRLFAVRVSVPDATPGHGVRLEVGSPAYQYGELTVGDRSFWGDLKFETRAGRARLASTLLDLRRQAPGILRSDAALVLVVLVFNWALVTLVVGLLGPRSAAAGR